MVQRTSAASTAGASGISQIDLDTTTVELGLVEAVDSLLSEIGIAVSDEAEATRVTVLIGCNFARKNITESGKCVMQCLRF